MDSLAYTGSCTAGNIRVRREWGNLSAKERREYISAVQCLARLPSKTSRSLAPGARSRYDDFIVGHSLYTTVIHNSGYLLPWHREMVFQLEQALRNECGYTGYQPYWDWSKWADTPDSSNPIFDGSDTSLSGNGKYVPHEGLNYTTPAGDPPAQILRAAGTGGGCIASGPFVNWTVNLGPISQGLKGQAGPPNPQADGFGYNPRCVIRDFLPQTIQALNSYQNVTELILNSSTIHEFHPAVESGIHAGGHGFIGGLNSDLFVSAGDPLFYMHHTMLDRVWSIWQSLDFDTRVYKDALDGTRTMLNDPPSGNVTLDDSINIAPFLKNVTVRDTMSPTNGRYCYIYD
ncbi:Di-copper centre-containing protein [Dissoconium aciculare CBS 342.82]|uniref:Di-copper centre-containing protein n=1 Tax=Dissoconium aciculare CBS 342.82 TaxID=1314786 RepID=A0A6J3M5I3_9PEZI|nr:Di-copper centre-containing protein [Dissoconium aciculare CBS 342.82]KAF1823321.1 Di-copper centre-containing protein [Dissoconium aciculare CBS 342.82]